MSTKRPRATATCAAAILVFAGFALGQGRPAEFAITDGLAEWQVLQRDAGNHANLRVAGRVSFEGASKIQARVMRRDAVLDGFDWRDAGSVTGQSWHADLTALPAGGPYTIEFRALGVDGRPLSSTRVCDVLVGDLWILAGQSNMEGIALLQNVEPPHELVHVFNMRYEWQVAEEPLHSSAESIDEAHWKYMGVDFPWLLKPGESPTGPLTGEQLAVFRKKRQYGAGLGLPFAKAMVERTGVPIGLIPCAHGGASVGPPFDVFPGWDPRLKGMEGKSLYGAMLTRVRAAGGRVAGVLWWQGENDIKRDLAARYEERFRFLIDQMRADLHQPALPFFYVQIGRVITEASGDWPAGWKKIQQVQASVERSISHAAMVPSVDLEMQDGIHISTSGQKVVGRRLANLACHELFPELAACREIKRGPRPYRAYVETLSHPLNAGRTPRHVLYIEFSDVNQRLRAPGRISGFSVRHADGKEIPVIIRASIDPTKPNTVALDLTKELPADAQLWYGWGTNPYCNLTDELNMGLPVFGPMRIEGAGQ